MNLTDDDKEQLRRIVEGSEPKIRGSAIFMGLLDDGWKKDPTPLIQLAISILYDKPIAIIAIDGQKVPEHLKKIAFCIERAEKVEDIEKAVKNVMQALETSKRELN